jgi:di/tricarboxylate transporter
MSILIFYLVLLVSLVLFITGWIRYDLVAILALLALVLAGIVPQDAAFDGFANPAVVTVVAVLVISKALESAGITNVIGRVALMVGSNQTLQVGFFCLAVAILSSFMNNVGALVLMMPVALETARRGNRSPSYLLMPMAFSSLLGGMTTLIGTPPNLLVSQYKESIDGTPLAMFDFTPVGLPVMLLGVIFLTLIGWRLIPNRTGTGTGEIFEISNYVAEGKVKPESKSINKTLRELFRDADDVTLVGFRRGDERYSLSDRDIKLESEDVLILRAEPRNLKAFLDSHQLELGGVKTKRDDLKVGEMELVEAVVMHGSTADNSTARRLDLRALFGINMIAIARHGVAVLEKKLSDTRFRAGDVLLLQMPIANMKNTLSRLGLLPLARRDLPVTRVQRLVAATAIFGIAITVTALNLLPSAVAFSVAAAAMILFRIINIRQAHDAIDWSVVILLGAMIPVGNAFETCGAVAQLTEWIGNISFLKSPILMLTVVLVITMCFSDILNNAATAIVMAPFSAAIAESLEVSPDPFLLAVAIGASCAFLTPIGHQSNTLVLGPGGYRFGDYFYPGVVLEVIVVIVTIPILSWRWGLGAFAN